MIKISSKIIIGIIQDFCFEESATFNCDIFSKFLAPNIEVLILNNKYQPKNIYEIAKKRNDFFIANNLEPKKFCKSLYKKLKTELSFRNNNDNFLNVLLSVKSKIENAICQDFDGTSEAPLRGLLATAISSESFLEARNGTGKSDIIIPEEKAIIEVKLWRGKEYYSEGLDELEDYMKNIKYPNGYYTIFDFNKSENEVIKNNGESFLLKHNGQSIQVLFYRMRRVQPSMIRKEKKKNAT